MMYGADVTHNYLTPNGFPRGLDKQYFDMKLGLIKDAFALQASRRLPQTWSLPRKMVRRSIYDIYDPGTWDNLGYCMLYGRQQDFQQRFLSCHPFKVQLCPFDRRGEGFGMLVFSEHGGRVLLPSVFLAVWRVCTRTLILICVLSSSILFRCQTRGPH